MATLFVQLMLLGKNFLYPYANLKYWEIYLKNFYCSKKQVMFEIKINYNGKQLFKNRKVKSSFVKLIKLKIQSIIINICFNYNRLLKD